MRQFHSTRSISMPRGSTTKLNRWGSYQRIMPASLANVDVRQMPHREVPSHIQKPFYVKKGISSTWGPEIPILSREEEQGMRAASQLAKQILTLGSTLCQPGITTNHIDSVIHEAIVEQGAYPSPLNYMGFPKSVCTSINNIIAHGIPDERPLQDGDIINIDVTVIYIYIKKKKGCCIGLLLTRYRCF
jgi:methionyl aminopeptidase